jgi:hypothetical protein
VAAAPQPRLRRGELATATWGLALLVLMFAVKWYGVDNIPGRSPTVVTAVDAWNGLSVLRWPMLVTILLTLASVALHLSQGDHGSQTDTSLLVAVAATLVAAGLVYRVLIVLPETQAIVDQKLGALLGLGCGLAMAARAWQVRRVVRVAARTPVVQHRRPRSGPAPATAAGGRAGEGAPTEQADAPLASPAAPPAPGGPPSDSAGSPLPGDSSPDGAGSPRPGDASSQPAEPALDGGASAPGGAEAPAGDPAPRRRRVRTSRSRPT